ncbi:uncharacterized protein LOC113464837 isoform X1 [Ceratina calcarata]|uniref:Uncharacterized protein LOC113464837 isoform X1 n=1 Tax=Ceratina calcarata TaxID=156304 RepID=A0AAJ7S914_9HYME|nr:uncharacterized protein LOC113464837 isoform X1 [Ceratina calcarata]
MMLGILRNCKTLGWLFPYSQVYPRSLKLFQVISSSAHAITMWKANKSRLCSDKYIIKKRLQKETRKILHVGGSLYSKLQNFGELRMTPRKPGARESQVPTT